MKHIKVKLILLVLLICLAFASAALALKPLIDGAEKSIEVKQAVEEYRETIAEIREEAEKANADIFVYLGGNEQSTHKYISEQLGKETIDTKSSSQSKGRNGSFSQSFQQTGRDLMTPDEVRLLDNKNAIVFIRGERPVIDEKYDLMKHPNVQYTEDGGAAPYVHSPHCLYDMRYLLSTMEETE